MRVVITTDCFLPRWDGIARFLSLLLPGLKGEVTVFAPAFEGDLPLFGGVRVVRFPLVKVRFGDIFFCRPDKRVMREAIRDADVVFNQTIGPVGIAGIRLARKLGKPVVSYVHSAEWELARRAVRYPKRLAAWVVRLLARMLYNRCSLLMVPSKQVADLLSSNGVKTKKELVRLGVPVKVLVPPHSKAVAKRKVGIAANKQVVGFCGRIAREKDLPTLYEAFQRVQKKYRNAVLLIVGEGLEEEIPPSRKVLRVGRQDDVVPFLQAMDVFVLPSLTETSSLATMEAMAAGLPVVVTPVGSIREYVEHKKNGLLFSRRDVGELVENLEFLLGSPKKRVELGRAARKTMVRKYSWAGTVRKIRGVLSRLLG